MQNERHDDNGRASQVNQTSTPRPEAPAAVAQEDVGGFLDIVRLGPPICLPVLPKPPYERPEFEPLGDPRQRQVAL